MTSAGIEVQYLCVSSMEINFFICVHLWLKSVVKIKKQDRSPAFALFRCFTFSIIQILRKEIYGALDKERIGIAVADERMRLIRVEVAFIITAGRFQVGA